MDWTGEGCGGMDEGEKGEGVCERNTRRGEGVSRVCAQNV